MARLYLSLILVLVAQAGYAIHFFKGTFQQALSRSKTEHKKVFLYFTAKWCGPCRLMETNVFHSDSITTLIDEQFVALKLDYEAWTTKPLLDKYKVGGLPTFMVINAQEVLERQAVGFLSISQLVAFLEPHWQPSLKMAALTEMTQFRYELKKDKQAKWNVELGVQAGLTLTQVSSLAPQRKVGYDVGLLVAFTHRRLSIRPGLCLRSVGGRFDDRQVLALQYVAMPVQLAYLLRKTALFGLPGGYRASLTPYVAKLINQPSVAVSPFDYGSKLGLGAFIGDTSQVEAQLGYQLGLTDIDRSTHSGVYNRGVYWSVSLVF